MIDSSSFHRLRGIGLAPALVQHWAQHTPCPLTLNSEAAFTLMRVTEVQREGLTLNDGLAEHAARLLPALRTQLSDAADALAVGDWVWAQRNDFDEWWVQQRLPPLNQLARRQHDGRDKATRVVIVSNVDTVLLVMGLDHDFNLRRLERYLALVRMAHVSAVVVLTKRDLAPDNASQLQAAQAQVPPDVPVLALNALGDEPQQQLAPWLQPAQTVVLLGSSGAGKSTLTNALLGAEAQHTSANRAGDNRGRHTTTTRTLHTTAQGACIIDTPGLRTLRLDGNAGELEAAFADIAKLAPRCRFRDCQHEAEPGCAVRESVSPERLRNYRKLLREARRDTLTALQRKGQLQQWKVRSRAVRERSKRQDE